MKMKNKENISLYEASGLKEVFENAEKIKEEERKKKEEEFWKDIEKREEEIDPFWLS